MNHWNQLLHHHQRNTGYMRGPSYPDIDGTTGDTGALTDTLLNAQTPTQKMLILGAAGAAVGHFAFKKKTILGALIGAAGGYYLAAKQSQTG